MLAQGPYLQCVNTMATLLKTTNNNSDSETGAVAPIVSEMTQMANTVIADSRPLLSEDAVVGGSNHDNTFAEKTSMAEDDWTVANVFEKPLLVSPDGMSLGIGNVAGDVLATIRFPEAYVNAAGPANAVLQTFTFWRTGFDIRIILSSPKFYAGKLVAYIRPVGTTADVAGPYDEDYRRSTQFPHVMLDLSFNTNAEIRVPYTSPQNFISTINNGTVDERTFDLVVVVFNPLRTNSYTTDVPIKILASAINASVHVPVFPHPIVGVSSEEQDMRVLVQGPLVDLGSNLVGTLAGTAATALGASSETAATISGTVARGLQLGAAMKGINFDRPNINETPIRDGSILGHGAGPILADRLGLTPVGTATPIASSFPSSVDIMKVNELCRLPGWYNTVQWSTTEAPGTILTGGYVHPADVNPVADDTNNAYIVDSFLSYCSRAYAFWAGSIEYRIQAVATQFHSGKLIAAFLPGLSSGSGVSLKQMMACPNIVMDLNENKEWVFKVPYNSVLPWLRVVYPYVSYDPIRFSEACLGYLAIAVFNPLTANNAVAPLVELNVFIAGGPDFKLKSPRGIRMFPQHNDFFYDPLIPTPTRNEESKVSIQGPMVGPEFTRDEVAESSSQLLQFGQNESVSSVTSFAAEDTMDLRVLLRRQFLVAASAAPTSSDPTVMFSQFIPVQPLTYLMNRVCAYYPTNSVDAAFGRQSSDLLSYFSRLYAFWAGSMRFTFLNNYSKNVNGLISAYHHTDATTISGSSPYYSFEEFTNAYSRVQDSVPVYSWGNFGHTAKNLCQAPTLTVEVPHDNLYPMMQQALYRDPAGGDIAFESRSRDINGFLQVMVIADNVGWQSTNNKPQFFYYKGMGDDFTFQFVIAPPKIVIRKIDVNIFNFLPDDGVGMVQQMERLRTRRKRMRELMRLGEKEFSTLAYYLKNMPLDVPDACSSEGNMI